MGSFRHIFLLGGPGRHLTPHLLPVPGTKGKREKEGKENLPVSKEYKNGGKKEKTQVRKEILAIEKILFNKKLMIF